MTDEQLVQNETAPVPTLPSQEPELTEEEIALLETKATAIIQDESTKRGINNIMYILNRPLLEYFLLPLQQQDELSRKLRDIITANRDLIRSFIRARLQVQAKEEAAKVLADQESPGQETTEGPK